LHGSSEPVETVTVDERWQESIEDWRHIMIDTPGVYNMPLADYLADPCPDPAFSTSVAHALVTKTPLHCWMQHPRLNPNPIREESNAMDLGTVAHSILLEGHMNNVVVVDAADWRTNKAKEERETARLQGKTAILAHKATEVIAMVKAAQSAIDNSELAVDFKRGHPERTLIWQEGKMWCKSRPDWLTLDAELTFDYKTTAGSAEPTSWMRGPMLSNGCDLQAVLGMRAIRKLFTPRNHQFIFMVQEVEPPYAMSFVGLSPAFLDVAERKLSRALQLWQDCLLTNTWPGYPSRVAWVEPPAWVQMEEGVQP
jgi:hypothetical protein